MRTFKTEGIIIKRQNFLETDKLLTVFTKDFGKLTIKAKGVRKIISKRSSHVELLNYVSLSLYKTANMPILIEAQSIEQFSKVKNNLFRVAVAYHICELIDGLLAEGQEHKDVFKLLLATLHRLSDEKKLKDLVKKFEIDLLIALGFWTSQKSFEIVDTQSYIEEILERKLKSKYIFSKL